MNEKEMHDAINKGIPNSIKLELPVKDLIKYCSLDSNELSKTMDVVRKNYEEAIASIIGYDRFNHNFFNNLRLITNYKNSDTKIYVSPMRFYNRVKKNLGVINESFDLEDPELINEFNERLNKLDSINNIYELKENFPNIYEDSVFYPRKEFNMFLAMQKVMYRRMVKNIKNVMDFADNNPIDLDKFKGLDKDKFELFVAYKYLEYAKNTDEDKYKQSAIYYLMAYLNESCGKVIRMKYNNEELSNISLLKDFRKFLKSNRELKPVNENRDLFNSYHIKHVKNHINKYFYTLKDWCLVHANSSELLMKQQTRLEDMAIYSMEHPDYEKRDKKYLNNEKYMAMLMRKLNFYEDTNYALRLFGIGPFESHVAYFYQNGMVVIDKLYDESLNIDPTYDEAIYIMNIKTFLNMVSMDKPSLRENDNVKRIIHTGEWEKRLLKEINSPSISLNEDDAKELTMKYLPKKNYKKNL